MEAVIWMTTERKIAVQRQQPGLRNGPQRMNWRFRFPAVTSRGGVAAKQLRDRLLASFDSLKEPAELITNHTVRTENSGGYYKNPSALYESLSGTNIAFSKGLSRFDSSIFWPFELGGCRVAMARTLDDFYHQYIPGYEYYRDGEKDVSIIEDISKYTSGFFEGNALITVYKYKGCGYLNRVERIVKQGNELLIIIQTGRPTENGHYMAAIQVHRTAIEVSKSDMEDVEIIKVYYVPLNDARID